MRNKLCKYSFLIIVLTAILCSCRTKPLDIDLEEHEPKLVISNLLIPEQIMLVTVTESFSALEANGEDTASEDFLNSIAVNRARVTVSYSGKTDTLFKVQPGLYASLSTLQTIDNYYTLDVYDSATGRSISATTQLLPTVNLDSVSSSIFFTDLTDSLVIATINFIDPPENNYYLVNYYNTSNLDATLANFNPLFNNLTVQSVIFSDEDYDHANISDSMLLSFDFSPRDTITVTLSNISKGYYYYLVAREKSGGLVASLAGEPINRPTNIIGGFGFFNAHYIDATILLPE